MFKWIEAKRLTAAVAGLVAIGSAASASQVDIAFGASSTLSQYARFADGVVRLDRSKRQVTVTRSSGNTSSVQVLGVERATLLQLPDGGIWLEGLADAGGYRIHGQVVDISNGKLTKAPDDGLPQYANARYLALPDGRVLTVAGDGSGASIWTPSTGLSTPVATGALRPVDSLTLLRDGTVLLSDGGPTSPSSQVIDIAVGTQRTLSTSEAADLESAVPAWTAVAPAADSEVVLPNQRITVALSKAIDPDTVTNGTVVLFGPGGAAPATVSVIDDGRLLVVSPTRELFPGSRYTVFLKGLRSVNGIGMPFGSYGFNTASLGVATGQDSAGQSTSATAVGIQGSSTTSATSAVGSGRSVLRLSTGPQSVGVLRSNEDCKPGAAKLTLCRANSEIRDGAFYPGRDAALNSYGGHWRTYLRHVDAVGRPQKLVRSKSRPHLIAANAAATGPGSIVGRVLTIDGNPVANVTVSAGKATTRTSVDGVFTLKGLPIGQQVLFVDGASADRDGFDFGSFELGAAVPDSGVLRLNYNMYLPRVLPRDKVRIPSPTTQDIAITHPDIPGLEIDIPAGTVIHDRNGKVVTDLAVVPTPVDRAPFPTTNNYPVYFSIIPGGAVIQNLSGQASQGIRIKYPNYSHAKPGTVAKFWNYDDANGWQVYGKGKVSADGDQFVPDDGVALTTTIHGSFTLQPYQGGLNGNPCAGRSPCAKDGDPVDLQTGALVRTWRDLGITDILPLSLERTYRSGDTVPRAFGVGMSANLDWYLFDENDDFSQPKLILPNLTAVKFDPILGDPADSGDDVLAEWRSSASQGAFFNATLQHVAYTHNQFEEHWIIQTKTGEQYWFQNEQTNRLDQIVDRFGNTTSFDLSSGLLDSVTSPSGRTITFNYDSENRISSAVDSAGRTVNYIYNAAGYLGEVDYPDATNEKYTYDSSGNMLTITDRRGHTILTNVYTAGRVSQQTLGDGAIYQYNYQTGSDGSVSQVTTTEPNGALTLTVFDPISHYVSSQTLAYGTSLAQTTTYVRNSAGYVTSTTDSLSRTKKFNYDASGNVLDVTTLEGTAQAAKTSFTYTSDYNLVASITDPLGHLTTFSYKNGCLTGSQNALGKSVTRVCNSAGQAISISDALGHAQQMTYLGYDIRSVKDALGRTYISQNDVLGRLISVMDPQGNLVRRAYDVNDRVTQVVDARNRVSSLLYDENGNVKSVTLPGGAVVKFSWDNANRVATRTDALNHTDSLTYDSLGHVKTILDRNGLTSTHHYDVLGREDLSTFGDGSTISYAYDAGNRQTSLSDSLNGSISRSFDGNDRLLSETTPEGTVSYKYDLAGRRIEMDAASEAPAIYTYDDANQLSTISQGSEVVRFTYDDAGRRLSVTLPNGVKTGYSYDNADELTGLANMQAGGASLGSISYTYDVSGDVVTQSNALAPIKAAQATTAGSFDAGQRQTLFNGSTLSYDSMGHLTADGTNTYVWNARGQLVQVKQGASVTATYAYDGTGRRRSIEIGALPVRSLLYAGDNVAQETVGGVANPILVGPGVDERYARNESSGRTFFLTDAIGSTVALSDSSGVIVQQYQYDSYGNSMAASGLTNPYQYAGRENDGNGLYFNRARYYKPSMARFISEDPTGLAAGQNLYAYVSGNPLGFRDPYGLVDSLPQWVVDVAAGVGDGVSFGITKLIRDASGWGDDEVNYCSGVYSASKWLGSALPITGGAGRLMYAEASAGIREAVSATEGVEAQALEAAALRDGLKRLFRGNPSSTYKIMDPAQRLAEYYEGDAAAMMDAAGRTSPYVNALGAAALGGGIVNGARSDCGCQ